MNDPILDLVREIMRITGEKIAYDRPRDENEPFMSIWEAGDRIARKRQSSRLMNRQTRSYGAPVHAIPVETVQRLQRLRDLLSKPVPDGSGIHSELTDIGKTLRNAVTIV